MSHPVRYVGGRLQLGEAVLERVGEKGKTPFYAYDISDIQDRVRTLSEAFQGKADIHYAMKANSNIGVLKSVRSAGAGVDTVSGGEVSRALEAGYKPGQIIFSGVGKSVDELRLALRIGIKSINVESLAELKRIELLAKSMKCRPSIMLRLNPNVAARTHKYISTGGHENKFGFGPEEYRAAVSILKNKRSKVKLRGLAFHIGSQMFDFKPAVKASQFLIQSLEGLRAEGFDLDWADIGGGVGIPYEDGVKEANVGKLAKTVMKLPWPKGIRFLLEPGRYIVGRAGVLVSRVQYIKNVGSRKFLILDTGMHHLIRPSLYGAYHRILPLKKRSGHHSKCDVVGPICESSDFLAEGRMLPDIHQGDLVAILDAGAYGFTMASRYNLHELPKEILIK